MAKKSLWFKKKRPVDGTDVPSEEWQGAHIYQAWRHTSWGHNIEITNWEAGLVTAHLHRTPKIGDQFQFKMRRGGVGVCKVVSVRRPGDPSDLYFIQLEYMGTLQYNGVEVNWKTNREWQAKNKGYY